MSQAEQIVIADKAFDYFALRYGDKRAGIICGKIFPLPQKFLSLEDAKRLGDKWHAFNLILNKDK